MRQLIQQTLHRYCKTIPVEKRPYIGNITLSSPMYDQMIDEIKDDFKKLDRFVPDAVLKSNHHTWNNHAKSVILRIKRGDRTTEEFESVMLKMLNNEDDKRKINDSGMAQTGQETV